MGGDESEKCVRMEDDKKKHIEYLSANNVFDQDSISCTFHFHLLPFLEHIYIHYHVQRVLCLSQVFWQLDSYTNKTVYCETQLYELIFITID